MYGVSEHPRRFTTHENVALNSFQYAGRVVQATSARMEIK